MHQNDALGLFTGLPHHIAVDGGCTGLAAHSILGADVPVHRGEAFFSGLRFQFAHEAFAAVASADGVGAPARKAQIADAFRVDVGRDALLQQGKVLPVGVRASVDVAVLVRGRVECDLVPGGFCLGEKRQIFLVVPGRYHKKGGLDSGGVQRGQNVRRRLAGAVIEGQADPFIRRSGRRFRHRPGRHLACGRGDETFVRDGRQVIFLAPNDRRRSIETPKPKT